MCTTPKGRPILLNVHVNRKWWWIDTTEVIRVSEHIRIITGRHLLLSPLPTPEMVISHSRGPVRGHWRAAGSVSLRYYLRPLAGRQFAPHSTTLEGLEFLPIRVGFNSQYLRRHDTKHLLLPIWPHCAGRGSGKYLPSKAPVYPTGAVTSRWTPFNIYPCGFHRSAAQARQTLLIKTGACFKGPHSGHQSALAGQKSLGHVAAGKPEKKALFWLHFPSSSFSTIHSSKSKPRTCGRFRRSCAIAAYGWACLTIMGNLLVFRAWRELRNMDYWPQQHLDTVKNMGQLDAPALAASDCSVQDVALFYM